MPSGKLLSRLHDRSLEGLYYGLQGNSDGILIGSLDGVMKARSFKRLPLPDQDYALLLAFITRSPWCPVLGGTSDDSPIPAVGLKSVPDAVVAEFDLLSEPNVSAQIPLARRMHIRRQVKFAQYGCTDGCTGCDVAKKGSTKVV